ncbi:leucine-rich_repeat domain-containing protein [Hexamita inflata]|uniref:Leucine-rich repeat domain-containing protein n=1 Tax=Hexamita inflata TaxID=28002 RepID=A0AA86RRZ9_9EUKA|nr:leucine-rich repeat domain-containing protein [Hexamita inflata]
MTEQNQNALNDDANMILKYKNKIKNGNLQIEFDPEVINLRFVEKFNIQTLKFCIRIDMQVKLRSNTIKELILGTERFSIKRPQPLNLNVDDLELENLEVLDLERNQLINDQLYNIAKFKKLHSLNVSFNHVDLTHIHNILSLTTLTMWSCGLTNIDQITSLINLENLNLCANENIDIDPLCKVKSLINLNISQCNLKQIDQIGSLTNLEVLKVSDNQLLKIDSIRLLVKLKELDISLNEQIDIAPLKDLVSLIKLDLSGCNLRSINALKSLITLQTLGLSSNYQINVSELQYLRNLQYLNLDSCNLVSIYVLKPLMNLESLDIEYNNIVFLDANINEMSNLKEFKVQNNLVSDFLSLEKHPNFNNINKIGDRCFDISDQKYQSQEELYLELLQANKFRKIESPNIQLKEIQIQHKALKTALDNFKQQINEAISNARQSQIQYTANVGRIFQQMNYVGFE